MAGDKVAVLNRSTVLGDQAIIATLNSFVVYSRAVASEWALRTPTVQWFTADPGGAWAPLVLVDTDQDVPGALGYHDEQAGRPYGRDLVKTCMVNHISWQSCFTHELAEMLGDLHVSSWTADANGTLWATELCDPVESNSYTIDGVEVSDFVLPSWFDPQGKAPFSFMDKHKLPGGPGLVRPFQVAHGGYAIYAPQWPNVTQVFADGSDHPTPENGYSVERMWDLKLAVGSRSLRRYG